MNRKMDRFLHKKISIKNMTLSILDLLFLLAIMALGILIRFSLRHIESGDWTGSLSEWMNAIRTSGGFAYFTVEHASGFAYNCPYMYIMCLISYINSNFSDMYWLKLVSVIFDYLSAFAIYFIVFHTTRSKNKAILGFSAVILLPTVFINSAAWAQCDVIYTFFILLSLYYILKEKSMLSLLYMGIAFSFKLQAVFFLPFLIIMWLKNKVKLREFLMIPAVFLVSIIPAWIMGRNLFDLLGVYINEMDFYSDLTLSYPNFYTIFENNVYTAPLAEAGTFLTMAALGCLAYYIYSKNFKMTHELILTLALFSTAIVVFFLPHMHERYGFLADLIAIAYGLTHIRRVPAAIGYGLVSLIAYTPYLFKSQVVPLYQASLLFLLLIIYTGYDLYRQIQQNLLAKEPQS